MNEKIKNAWEWTKEHKSEIGIAVCATAATVCGVILFKNHKHSVDIPQAFKSVEDNWRPERLKIVDLGVGKLDDAMRYPDGTVELWMDNIPLADMGTLGDAITAQIPGIPGDNNVWALLSVKPSIVE